MLNSSYAPHESSSQLFSEKTWLQGALLSNIVYGVELALFATCFRHLYMQSNSSNQRRQVFLLSFITILFILGTIFVYSLAEFTQLAFIDDRNYPGGPAAFEAQMFWIPVDELGVVVFVMGNWLMDMLLVWRCKVILSNIPGIPMWLLMILPCGLFVASFALGVLFLVKTSRSSPYLAVGYSLAYFSTTLALNIIGTIFIVIRLMHHRKRSRAVLGSGHGSQYTNLAAVLVESASLYSVFSLMFLIPLALNYPLSSVFLQSMGQVQTVSSYLIILRVATGRSWTEKTGAHMFTASTPRPVHLRDLTTIRLDTPVPDKEMGKGGVMVTHEVITDHIRVSGTSDGRNHLVV